MMVRVFLSLALVLAPAAAEAAVVLRQWTATVVRVGPFLDATDGVTPETGITLGAADQAEVLKAGGGASVDISGATWAAVAGADGYYDLTLTAAHTDAIGELVVVVQDASVCFPARATFQVVEEQIYDAFYASGAELADVSSDANGFVTLADGSLTAGKIGADAITAAKIAADAIGASEIAADAIGAAELAAGAIDAPTFAADSITAAAIKDGALGGLTAQQVRDAMALDLTGGTTVNAGSLDAAIGDILVDTADMQPKFGVMQDLGNGATIGGNQKVIGDAVAGISISLGNTATQISVDQIGTNVDSILEDTSDMQPKIGTVTNLGGGATIAANLADIEGQTDDIGAAGAGLTSLPLNDLDAATVNAQVDLAINDAGLQYLWSADIAANTPAAGSLLADMVEDNAGVWRYKATALNQAPTGGGGAGDGSGLTAIPWNPAWDAEVESEVADGLAAYDPPTKAELDAGLSAQNTAIATIDTEVGQIKLQTDKLTFTTIGGETVLDANIEGVNDVQIIGDGSTTPWGPAP